MSLFEPEIILSFYGLKVSNTLTATLLTDTILITLLFFLNKKISIIPGKLQSFFEMIIQGLFSFTQQIAGVAYKDIFPWFATFFIFILSANLLGLLPGMGTIGFHEIKEGKEVFIPLLKASTSDFNTTFGLATVSLFATHVLALRHNGLIDYLKRFFSFNPVYLFVGIIELVSEVIKLFSLSFRLFGNIFAGEVVLHKISALFAFLAPIPFLFLESIVAFVQALVFSMLTMVFMGILTTPHSEGGEH